MSLLVCLTLSRDLRSESARPMSNSQLKNWAVTASPENPQSGLDLENRDLVGYFGLINNFSGPDLWERKCRVSAPLVSTMLDSGLVYREFSRNLH